MAYKDRLKLKIARYDQNATISNRSRHSGSHIRSHSHSHSIITDKTSFKAIKDGMPIMDI
jgi:hypothetical protein